MSEPNSQPPAPASAPPTGGERQPPTRIPARDRNRNNNNGNNNNALRNFKGKEASLPVLGTRKEAWTQNTTHFLKELENYVLRTFKQPAPIARGIAELEDPANFLNDELPTLTRCMEKLKVTLSEGTATETDVEKMKREADNDDKLAAVKMYQSSQMSIFSKKMDVTASNMTTLWGLIIGQCTKALVADIRAEHDYEDKAEAFDSIWLLKTIKRIVHGVTASSNDFHTAFCSIRDLYKFRQGNQSVDEYYNGFINLQELVGQADVDILDHTELLAKQRRKNPQITDEEVRQKYTAMVFMMNADPKRYGDMWKYLSNSLLLGEDKYPADLLSAIHMLQHWSGSNGQNNNGQNNNNRQNGNNQNNNGNTGGLSFMQCQPVAGTNGVLRADIQCFRCNQYGHFGNVCPNGDGNRTNGDGNREYQFTQMFLSFYAKSNSFLSPTLLIADTGSTFSSFFNLEQVVRICVCAGIRAYSNGGSLDYTKKGEVKVLPKIKAYVNGNSLANIIGFCDLVDNYPVTFDSRNGDYFLVHVTETEGMRFKRLANGLYGFDTSVDKLETIVPPTHTTFFSTVSKNKEYFSRQEIEGAEKARELQGRVGWPSDQQFKEALSGKGQPFINAPVTPDDVTRATAIHGGMAEPLLMGKMTRTKGKTFAPPKRIPIPAPLLEHHKNDILDIDFFYSDNAPYLLIRTRKILFLAIMTFNIRRKNANGNITYSRPTKEVIEAVDRVIAVHKDRGFEIEYVFGDNEFEKLEGKIDAALETCAAGEHNPYIEREIRVVKERQRCYWDGSPFKQVPKIVIDENLVDIIKWLNHYIRKNGISRNMSPGTIVRGNGPVDMGTLKATFLDYCIVYRTTTNDKTPRAARAIALRPSNNQGGYYFMSLKTGKRIHGFKWTRLATTQEVIDRVHELAEQQHAEYLDEEGFPKLDIIPGGNMSLESDDESYTPDDESISDEDLYNDETEDGSSFYDSEESFEPLDDESDENWESEDEEETEDAEFQNDNIDDDGTVSDAKDDDEPNTTTDPVAEEDALSTNNMLPNEELRSDLENEDEDDEVQQEDNLQESRSEDIQQELRSEDIQQELRSENLDSESNRRSKRERKQPSDPLDHIGSTSGKSYGNGFQFMSLKKPLTHTTTRQMNSTVVNHMFDEMCFNQMHASKGIDMFKERAVAALFKEYKQLNDMAVLGRVKYEELTDEDKKRALRAINLIKEKRDGKIKGRTCADGSKHRKFVPREDASSATLAVESLMALLVVFAHEKRDVAVFDVPGAYLHADLPPDKFVLLKIEGQFVDIMVDVNPEFKEDVRYENGKKVLYVQILKALYGMIESALLWYELYSTVLKEEGFEINKIDKCIAQKHIDGKPCTIGWYVDDNIVGHMKDDVITGLLSRIEEKFPGLTIQRGKKLDFLGINLEFKDNGKLLMDTIEYLSGMVKDFEEEIGKTLNRTYTTPGSSWLFKVREDSPKLSQDKADMMLKYIMKVAWAMKRTRPDLEPTNSFLMTRVHEPNKDDWHKLMRLMSFIKGTLNDKRVIGADSLHKMLTMVDSAHAVHRDMRGHTGGLITLGTGVVDTKSTKQKMNSRSSTETEHIGTSEYMPKNIYFEMLMGELGYKLKNYIAKDNESEIKLLKNGRDSCTWNSKHIAIKYFWVTDRIKNGDIEVVYCPTEEMLADFMSKPVQGSLFKNFRAALMGWTHMSELYKKYNDLEERVGNKVNDDEKIDESVTSQTSVTSQASRIAESKRSTYAEAVKKHNVRFMEGINEQSSLKRNNPFLKHLYRLI